MKKNVMSKLVVALLFIVYASSANAAAVTHTGIIKTIYFNDSGNFALKFYAEFENEAVAECPSFNGFAGGRAFQNYSAQNNGGADYLKAILFDAYKTQSSVTIVTNGCLNSWIRIRSAFGNAPTPD